MKIMENHVNKIQRKSTDKTIVAEEIVKNIEKSSMSQAGRNKSHKSKFILLLCHKKN